MTIRLRPRRPGSTGLLFVCATLLACGGPAEEQPQAAGGSTTGPSAQEARADEGSSPPGAHTDDAPDPEGSNALAEPVINADGSVTYPHGETVEPLTEADEALLARDPAELTKDERREQAFLRRRRILLDPSSERAKALVESMGRIQRGELQPPVKPTSGEPSAAPGEASADPSEASP